MIQKYRCLGFGAWGGLLNLGLLVSGFIFSVVIGLGCVSVGLLPFIHYAQMCLASLVLFSVFDFPGGVSDKYCLHQGVKDGMF